MKKVLLTLLTALFSFCCFAQQSHIGTQWEREKMYAVRDNLVKPVTPSYALVGINLYDKNDIGYFEFENAEKNAMILEFRKGFVNKDLDMGKKGDPVVEEIIIHGFYPDLFKIYKEYFMKDADLEAIKTKGYGPAATLPGNITAYLSKGVNRGAAAYLPENTWTLRIKKR